MLLAILAACAPPPEALPTESPTPTPTPVVVTAPPETPTPTPIVTSPPPPPPTPTRKPRPTSNVAGLQLIPYYTQTRQVFPAVMPPVPVIDFDEPAGDDFDAQFLGLNATGVPIFAVREDFTMTPRTAYHEIGHAFEKLLDRKRPDIDWRARYWTYRGFPGTWQDAAKSAANQASGPAQWIWSPAESWAEAFSIAMVGGGQEKTLDYGRTINPVEMRNFFQTLALAVG